MRVALNRDEFAFSPGILDIILDLFLLCIKSAVDIISQFRTRRRFKAAGCVIVYPFHRSKKGENLVTRKGNSSVTSTRAKYLSSTPVCLFVYEKMASTIFRLPLSREGRTSTAVSDELVAKASAVIA